MTGPERRAEALRDCLPPRDAEPAAGPARFSVAEVILLLVIVLLFARVSFGGCL